MFDPITLLAGLGPLVTDVAKTLVNKYIAPDTFKPTTIEQYIKMKQMDIDSFNAMNQIGGNNPSYPWVEAMIKMQRPLVVYVGLLVWSYTKITNTPDSSVDNFMAAIGFYLFMDRTLFYTKKAMGMK